MAKASLSRLQIIHMGAICRGNCQYPHLEAPLTFMTDSFGIPFTCFRKKGEFSPQLYVLNKANVSPLPYTPHHPILRLPHYRAIVVHFAWYLLPIAQDHPEAPYFIIRTHRSQQNCHTHSFSHCPLLQSCR